MASRRRARTGEAGRGGGYGGEAARGPVDAVARARSGGELRRGLLVPVEHGLNDVLCGRDAHLLARLWSDSLAAEGRRRRESTAAAASSS
jgi:hypothetical protein